MKLFLHVEIDKKNADLMLFEELIEQKHVLYSSSLSSHKFSRSDTRGQTVVESINGILERVRVESEYLGLDRVNFENFSSRCNTFSSQMYSDFKESGKYNPQFYVPPEGIAETLEDFLNAPEPVYLLSGEQGRGKSALVCHWTRQMLGLDGEVPPESSATNGVFLFETHRANVYKDPSDLLGRCIKDSLQLEQKGDLLAFIETAVKKTPDGSKLVFIFDAVNEFETIRTNGRALNRLTFLLNELLGFIDRCTRLSSMENKVKFIITLRWELLSREGLSPDQFEAEMVRNANDNLFFNPDPEGRLFVEVPTLNDTGLLYERIRQAGVGMSPAFGWDDVSKSLKAACSNPMMLQVFMKAYDGCERSQLDVKSAWQLEDKYVDRLFLASRRDPPEEREAKNERGEIVHLILKQMKKETSQHLVLDPKKGDKDKDYRKLLDKIWERSRVDKDGSPRSNYYNDLIENSVVREDLVKVGSVKGKHSVPVKRLSFMHELVIRFIMFEDKRQFFSFYSKIVYIGVFLTILISLFGLIRDAINSGINNIDIYDILLLPVIIAIIPIWSLLSKLIIWLAGMMDKLFGPSELLLSFDKSEYNKRAVKFAIFFGTLLSLCLLTSLFILGYYGIKYKGISNYDDIFFNTFILYNIYAFALFIGPIGAMTTLAGVISIDSEALLRSNAYGWSFLVNSLGTVIVCLGGAIMLLFMPISVYIVFVLALILGLLCYPIFGLLFIRLKKKRSTKRKRWPENPEKFGRKVFSWLIVISIIIIPATVTAPVIMSKKVKLNFGNAKITLDEGIYVSDGRYYIKISGDPESINHRPQDFQNIDELKNKKFHRLEIVNTEIRDLKPLMKKPDRPDSLYLANNPLIQDYSPLLHLSLDYLRLEGNDFQDISFLDSINDETRINKSLKELELIDTKIEDLSPLIGLNRLRNLNISGTPVKDTTTLEELRNRGVEIVGYY
ncbi:hypothetical protein ACFL4P_02075 [Gemmatimonadota bacterium]